VVEKLIRHTLETAKARNLSSRARGALEKRHHRLRLLHHEFKDSLYRLVDGKGLLRPFDDKRHLLRLFGIAVVQAYFLGSTRPAPRIEKRRTAKAIKNTTGRIPKWYAVADKVRADLARESPRNNNAMAHNKTAKRNFLHPHINEALEKAGMKPKSKSAVRDYLAYVDRKRT
jgi:hypothetical protein